MTTDSRRVYPRRTRGRTRAATVIAACALLAVPVMGAASPAGAAVTVTPTSPPANNHSVIVFPERDFIHGDGYAKGSLLLVQDFRGGVQVGVANNVPVVDDPKTPAYDGLFDLNHLGTPCWEGVTPDILPGDVIRVTESNGAGAADETPVADVTLISPVAPSGANLVMHGRASDGAGHQLPVGSLEARVVANQQIFHSTKARTLRASSLVRPPDGSLAYDSPTALTWTATWTGLDQFDINMALANESRALWLGRAVGAATTLGSPVEGTLFEWGLAGGPGAGCFAPLARNGLSNATPGVVNAATGDLVLTGVSRDATAVSVSLSDAAGHSITPMTTTPAPATGSQVWSVTVPAAARAALADGTLTASATVTGLAVTGAAVTTSSLTIQQDTVAPAAPLLSLPSGSYVGAQLVSVTGSADTSTLRYQIGASAVPDPTPTSPAVPGQIDVTSSQSLKVVAFDAAGNASPVTAATYTISPPAAPAPVAVGGVVPGAAPPAAVNPAAVAPAAAGTTVTAATRASAPRILAAKAGKPGGRLTATASWRAPLSTGGSRITGYRLIAQRMGAKGTVARTTSSRIESTARSATLRLVAGTYRFRVVAVNAVGTSAMSSRSNAVRSR